MRTLIFAAYILIPLIVVMGIVALREWMDRRADIELTDRLNRRAAR